MVSRFPGAEAVARAVTPTLLVSRGSMSRSGRHFYYRALSRPPAPPDDTLLFPSVNPCRASCVPTGGTLGGALLASWYLRRLTVLGRG